jgi:hypothetical protein
LYDREDGIRKRLPDGKIVSGNFDGAVVRAMFARFAGFTDIGEAQSENAMVRQGER